MQHRTRDRYFYCNERFHDVIYAGSHNSFLREQAQQLHRRLRPYRRLQLRVRDRMSTSFSEHDAVVKAIVAAMGTQRRAPCATMSSCKAHASVT